ncbi:HAMP domain-containing sensor histidine kinase [Dyadobacter sp. 676]|uniref:histidine kinase n=1 Tax=Dyadobacter sp. 676 TaxID=3088362 RepID=A0AAU8FH36_9BACT
MQKIDSESLTHITEYLFNRREAILNNWRMACENDDKLSKVSSLTRQEFNNLMPVILDILEQRLLGLPPQEDLSYVAGGHGLHRWHKALALIETMRELNHLSEILYRELETYEELFADTDKSLLLYVHREITSVLQETFTASVQKYDELQRLHAAGRLTTLESALETMNELARERGNILRKSSHDLRGSVSIASSAATLLQLQELTDDDRQMYLEMLNRNLANVQSMLTELMDLSRLESGQEALQIGPVDVSQLLRELVEGAQGMAREHRIILKVDGPDSLTVQTDSTKLRRIAQNLLVNALSYSSLDSDKKGIVSVSWSLQGSYHWVLSIQDSGPGISGAVTKVLSEQLRPTVESTAVLGPDLAEPDQVLPVNIPEIPSGEELEAMSEAAPRGEGVGLQIVKHLCNMLHANLEVETQPGRGTLFRVRMPVSFPANK